MAHLAVTAIGADQPGIIATVAEVLRDRGGNVEDSAMTILGGHFAIMLLVTIDEPAGDLQRALAEATGELGLTVSVTPAEGGRDAEEPTHVLSVYGADRPGLLAGMTRALADADVNVTDLQTRLLGASGEPVYAMVFEVWAPDSDELAETAAAAADQLDVDHTLRPIGTQQY